MSTAASLFSFDLTGRTAVLTGASSGLGVGFVHALRTAGARVVAAARRADALHEHFGGDKDVLCVPTDVSLAESRAALIERAVSWGGSVDILVNNAGTSGEPQALDEAAATFASVLEVNLTAPFHLSQLVAQGGGPAAIVNIASIASFVATAPAGGASYVASKAGLVGLTRELAAQWGPLGIRVNALAPGWFVSEMNAGMFANERSRQWVERQTMLRRLGQKGELHAGLLLLCSEASAYMTGSVLTVDGGWTAR